MFGLTGIVTGAVEAIMKTIVVLSTILIILVGISYFLATTSLI